MQDNLMQAQTQPFVKLAQANMDLLTRFSTSPEVTESAMKLMNSSAFAHLMQGMMKNYTEFVTELSQSGMAMLSQGQAAMTRQMQDAASGVIDVADVVDVRGRRARQAA